MLTSEYCVAMCQPLSAPSEILPCTSVKPTGAGSRTANTDSTPHCSNGVQSPLSAQALLQCFVQPAPTPPPPPPPHPMCAIPCMYICTHIKTTKHRQSYHCLAWKRSRHYQAREVRMRLPKWLGNWKQQSKIYATALSWKGFTTCWKEKK